MKLDIGCGAVVQDGYYGIDRFVKGDNITNADMWALPYADNTIEEILSSHALEHIPKRQIIPTLQEWCRVLEPGGRVIILVPDLEWCVQAWLEHKTNDWWLDIIFGNQDHPGEFHLTGYTVQWMIDYLTAAKFVNISTGEAYTHRQNTLIFVAEKPKNVS